MALTTIQTQFINKSSPVHNDYSLGSRLQFLSTDDSPVYGTTSGGFYIQQVTTAGTSNTTAQTATAFHGPHGLIYNTGTGYFTLAAPVPGCHLTWFHMGATSQFIRSCQSGNAATGPSFHVGTGTTYTHIEASPLGTGEALAGMSLDFYGLTNTLWLVASHTSDDALMTLTTSSG